MKNLKVYDMPTRLFHWIFAACFSAAFLIAKTVSDDSVVFSYHMMLGLMMVMAIGLRIIWGLFGTRYAQFKQFALNPLDLTQYFKDLLTGKTKLFLGHNPASSWAAVTMMGLGLGLGVTGYLMATGQKETFEDAHELFGNLFLFVVVGHILGIVFHTYSHKDPIGLSMVTGNKNTQGMGILDKEIEPVRSHLVVGVIFVLILGFFGSYLARNFDNQKRTLQLFGNTLTLGENEDNGENEGNGQSEKEDDDD